MEIALGSLAKFDRDRVWGLAGRARLQEKAVEF